MFDFLWACFPRKSRSSDPTEATALLTVRHCPFCSVTEEAGFKIAFEDTSYIAFQDRAPAAQHHFLVIPRRHIESVKSLQKKDVLLVRDMERIGTTLLDGLDIPSDKRLMGFHIPPFNSVDHLHLHVFGLPWKSFIQRDKYPVKQGSSGSDKGWSWFVEVGQAARILEKGCQITVTPC